MPTAKPAATAKNPKPAKKAAASKKYDNLMRVSARDFSVGMMVDTGLYVNQGGNFVLLCSNSVLSQELVDKLNDFELSGDSLLVDGDYYDKMEQHYALPTTATESKMLDGEYEALRNSTYEAFHQIGETERIPWEQITKLVIQIVSQLEAQNAPAILQSLSVSHNTTQYLYTHSINVALMNGLMAHWLGKNKKDTETLIQIGLLHDVGKLRIPEKILNKPGKLTSEEFEVVKRHSVYSQELLAQSGVTDECILQAVRSHHEQANGCGYPDRLTIDKIPEFARITAISDIYDAMVVKRVYGEPATPFQVLEKFATDRFSQLDIQLANLFLTKVSSELVGKNVKLSNGKTGEVLYVDRERFGYPLVRVGTKTVVTDEKLRCVALVCD